MTSSDITAMANRLEELANRPWLLPVSIVGVGGVPHIHMQELVYLLMRASQALFNAEEVK